MMASMVASGSRDGQSLVLQGVDPETCMIVFKNHWAQVFTHDPPHIYMLTDANEPGKEGRLKQRDATSASYSTSFSTSSVSGVWCETLGVDFEKESSDWLRTGSRLRTF
ncbi:unnamed protein product [Tetraodon nigroviridis]|uniref:(spotted green pufferfish) hypothetical protein n=1 Tax=Tetraodon nigroviridis TaxID=99883 RepID=Q4T8S4_TETNG|nr:unnamed protein product [Tetraodon nigroviridis]